MKIAVIAPSQIPARRANTMQVMKMTQALQQIGHAVQVVSPGKKPEIGWDELKRHYGLKEEFPIIWLAASSSFRRYDFSLRAVAWARRQGAEIIYTRLPQAAALASWKGIPTILESHDLPQGRLGPWMFLRFLKGRGAKRLVVITQALGKDLHERWGAPSGLPFTLTAPDGVDLERYADLPTALEARRSLSRGARSDSILSHLSEATFTAGYTGHLYPGRGIELIVELAEKRSNMTFLVAGGEQHEVARLQAELANNKINNLLLAGFIPNAELPLYQAACDVLLMPYQPRVAASSGGDIARYLSPMKLFEYMACERPIISSDLPVLQEILTSQNAILLPTGDTRAWWEALDDLKHNLHLGQRLASQARQDVDRYTWETRASKIMENIP